MGAETALALRLLNSGPTVEEHRFEVVGACAAWSAVEPALLSLYPGDFRDSDYHFVTPIVVPAGGTVTMTIDCRRIGRPVGAPAPSRCTESLFLGGTMKPATGG